jgi:tail fiber protein gp53
MANLSENPVWEDGIYRIETTDPVIGGETGISNASAKGLANRTAWLKAQVIAIAAEIAGIEAAFALLDSPAFTGDPTAPTAPKFDNDLSLANTAFVSDMGLSFRPAAGVAITANISLSLAQSGGWLDFQADNLTAILPLLSTTFAGLVTYTFRANGKNGCKVKGFGTNQIHGQGGASGNTYNLLPNETITFVSNGPGGDWYTLMCGINSGGFGSSLAPVGIFDGTFTPTTSSGYQRLPSGLLLQWGVSSINGQAISFPVAFPNGWLSVFANENNATGVTAGLIFMAGSITNAGFQAQLRNDSGASVSGVTFRWVAIGY